MSARGIHLGYGLYFIDVLACLLFALALAVSVARFGRELGVEITLPEAPAPPHGLAGAALPETEITLRQEAGETRVYLGAEPVALDRLAARLRKLAPPAVLVRSETSPLTRVIAESHAAGVDEIRLAYRPAEDSPGARAGPERGDAP